MTNSSTISADALKSASAAQPNRLASGGLIDRSRPLTFEFDGQTLPAFFGDSLASALLANDKKLLARSFKYHRPRGIFTAGSGEPNALMTIGKGAHGEPNCKATCVELDNGMVARSQNGWPGVRFDIGAINSVFSPFMPAGFYYKTFMWPSSFWEMVYEPLIRRMAGLGPAPTEADPDRYETQNEFCDLLVVGSGPAGLAAALAAGRSGARVMLCEEDFTFGGRLNCEICEIGIHSGADWAKMVIGELGSMPNVRLCPNTAILGVYDGLTHLGVQTLSNSACGGNGNIFAQKLWKIVARQVILAAGADERPIVFGGNDRVGVMLASAVRTYINRYGVAPGKRAAIFTNNDDGWRTLRDLELAGVKVAVVVDHRENVAPQILALAKNCSARIMTGARVVATTGWKHLRRISVEDAKGKITRFNVDLLAVSGGWNPNIALTGHLGAKPVWSERIAAFVPPDMGKNTHVAGAAAGHLSLGAALSDGIRAASLATGGKARLELPQIEDESTAITPLWLVAGSRGKAFVDLQNDVTSSDIDLAWREGFQNPEHIKRYTTMSMGTDQGRTGNMNGLAKIALANKKPIGLAGNMSGRPPYVPVRLAALAGGHRGRHFRPTRQTSANGVAKKLGARLMTTGQWLRPQWYAQTGETKWLDTVSREAVATRKSVGICDVSTLGKIDVQGEDAAAFLDRVYINNMAEVALNKTRYGVMLRQDGFVLDDGTAARFAHDHFVISTTSANALAVMQHLNYCHQVLWPELDVQMVSVTEQWSQYAIAGPNSRNVLAALVGDFLDVSNEAFPFMACARFELDGIQARAFRVSFSGERAYEIAVPAQHGKEIFERLLELGAPYDITPYGTEALGVLRIEKGHFSGPEISGQTTPRDLGLGRMMKKKKDFVGRVLAGRQALVDPDRPSLVGLKPENRRERLFSGAHILNAGARPTVANDQGYVTSAAYSPHMGQWIGLGLVSGGMGRQGETVRAYDPVRNGDIRVQICPPVFFDPDGERLRG